MCTNSDCAVSRGDHLLVFFLLLVSYAYIYHDPGWNGNSRFGLTMAMVEEGRLTIDNYHNKDGTQTGDKAFFKGHYYSDKAIGASLLAAGFYAPMYHLSQWLNVHLPIGAVKYLLTVMAIGLPSALAGTLLFRMGCSITGNRLRAFFITLMVSFGTMNYPFSQIFFGHQLAAACLIVAFYVASSTMITTAFYKAVFGFLLGYALLTEYTTGIVILALVVYYFYVIRKEARNIRTVDFLMPVAGSAIPLIILAAYNLICFNHPFSIAYEHVESSEFAIPMSQGFMGIRWPNLLVIYYLTLHPAQGLFWQSPMLGLTAAGCIGMWRQKQKTELMMILFSFSSYLLVNSGYFMWWGGDSFGPRHLVPVVPFLAYTLYFLPPRWMAALVSLGLVSMFHMLLAASSRIWIAGDVYEFIQRLGYFGYSAIYDGCLGLLRSGRFARNIGTELFHLKLWWSLVPLVAIQLVFVAIFVWRGRTRTS